MITHDEMAAELRAAGWTVTRPVEAVPELAVGQVWEYDNLRRLTWTIVDLFDRDGVPTVKLSDRTNWQFDATVALFVQWSRDSNARLMTP